MAVRAELERRDVLEATDDYLTELATEVGEPTERQQSRADAIVVALAEPGGTVLTSDKADIQALAAHAHHVTVETL